VCYETVSRDERADAGGPAVEVLIGTKLAWKGYRPVFIEFLGLIAKLRISTLLYGFSAEAALSGRVPPALSEPEGR
jgi:hypothetical protein